MSEEAGNAVEMSTEPMSTEIGSGAAEDAVIEESGLAVEADGAAIDELASEVEDAIEDGASDAEIAQLVETFKLKVNGQDKEVTLDWNDKEDIIRRLQMAEAGQGAMQKSAEMEKAFQQEVQGLINDPWKALEELGFDPDELAEQRIQKQIAQLQKTPEQIAQESRDSELEQLRQQLKAQEDEQKSYEYKRLEAQAEVDLDSQITEALSSTTELPKSPYVVKRIADALLTAMDNGREDVQVADVIPWVQKEIQEELQGLFGSMPDKVLEQYIGSKANDRLRQGRLSKMKKQPAAQIKDTGANNPESKEAKKKVKIGNWLRHGSSLSDFD